MPTASTTEIMKGIIDILKCDKLDLDVALRMLVMMRYIDETDAIQLELMVIKNRRGLNG